jgi:hypothetical protein
LAERKRQERKWEQEDNLAEISALLQGDLLSENLQQAARSFGPHRVMPDHWKGMSPEQLQEIRLAQKQQVQEKLVPFPSPPSSEPPLSPVALCSPAPVFSLSQGHAHQGGCLKEFPFWWGEHVKGVSGVWLQAFSPGQLRGREGKGQWESQHPCGYVTCAVVVRYL